MTLHARSSFQEILLDIDRGDARYVRKGTAARLTRGDIFRLVRVIIVSAAVMYALNYAIFGTMHAILAAMGKWS